MSNSWIRPIPRPPSRIAALPLCRSRDPRLATESTTPVGGEPAAVQAHPSLPGGPRSKNTEKEVQRCLAFMVWFRREHRGKLLFVHCCAWPQQDRVRRLPVPHATRRHGCRNGHRNIREDAPSRHPAGVTSNDTFLLVYFSTLSNRPRRGCAGRGRSSNSNRWSRCSVRAGSNSDIAALKSP